MAAAKNKTGGKHNGHEKATDKAHTIPNPERDIVTEITVLVHGYGRPEQVTSNHMLSVGAALHRNFGDDFEIVVGGKRFTYDALAAAGHHLGHTEVLHQA